MASRRREVPGAHTGESSTDAPLTSTRGSHTRRQQPQPPLSGNGRSPSPGGRLSPGTRPMRASPGRRGGRGENTAATTTTSTPQRRTGRRSASVSPAVTHSLVEPRTPAWEGSGGREVFVTPKTSRRPANEGRVGPGTNKKTALRQTRPAPFLLDRLRPSVGTLMPVFSPTTHLYTLNVPEETEVVHFNAKSKIGHVTVDKQDANRVVSLLPTGHGPQKVVITVHPPASDVEHLVSADPLDYVVDVWRGGRTVSLSSDAEEEDEQPMDATVPGTVMDLSRSVRKVHDPVEELYRATHVFDAEGPNELSLTPGDVLVVVLKSESGWWAGFREDNPQAQGWFPAHSVELLRAAGLPPLRGTLPHDRSASVMGRRAGTLPPIQESALHEQVDSLHASRASYLPPHESTTMDAWSSWQTSAAAEDDSRFLRYTGMRQQAGHPGNVTLTKREQWQALHGRGQQHHGVAGAEAPASFVQQFPYFTVLLVVAQFVMFIVAVGKGGFASMKVNPMAGADFDTLKDLGARWFPEMEDGGLYLSFTALFLPVGLLRLLVDALLFWQFSALFERTHGWLSLAFVFFAAGISGHVAGAMFLPRWLGTGPGAALFGIIGGLATTVGLSHWQEKPLPPNTPHPAVWVVLIFLGMLFGAFPGQDNWSQITGLVIGAIAMLAVLGRESALVLMRAAHLQDDRPTKHSSSTQFAVVGSTTQMQMTQQRQLQDGVVDPLSFDAYDEVSQPPAHPHANALITRSVTAAAVALTLVLVLLLLFCILLFSAASTSSPCQFCMDSTCIDAHDWCSSTLRLGAPQDIFG